MNKKKSSSLEVPHLWRIMGRLFLFGIMYDYLTTKILKSNRGEQKSSFFVVGGVIITIMAGIPIIGKPAAKALFLLFAASGLPMIFGQLNRHSTNMRRARRRAAAQRK